MSHLPTPPSPTRRSSDLAAAAFDLADRLQTPVFVMSDLDIGMNQRLCAPFAWDDARAYDRGKVMTAEQLEAGAEFARYKDVDGDGIPWRTWPGTRSEEHTSELQSLMRISYAVLCLKKTNNIK